MFDSETLTRIAEDVIVKEEERTHLEETGAELIHYDFHITKSEPVIYVSGRSGDFYKFTFEYELSVLDEKGLLAPDEDLRHYRRSVRLDLQGKVVAIGNRQEI